MRTEMALFLGPLLEYDHVDAHFQNCSKFSWTETCQFVNFVKRTAKDHES